MKKQQARLIGSMCQHASELQRFHQAYKELLSTCSDVVPAPATKPQVVVAFTASSSAPPSTPKSLGPEWWNDRFKDEIKDLKQENDDLIEANVDMVSALNHWGLENKHVSLVDNICDVIKKCAELKKELEVAGKKRKAIIEAGNNVSTLLKLLADISIYTSHQIVAKQHIALWEDNTTP